MSYHRRQPGGRDDRNRQYKSRFPPRHKETPPQPPESILASLLFTIGDDNEENSVEKNIEALASSLESKLNQHKSILMQLFIPIVFTQPVKTSLYGTLIGLLNNRVPELGKEIVAKLCKIFQEAFDEVHPYKLRLLFRFGAELIESNVIKSDSYVELLLKVVEQCDPDKNGKMVDTSATDSACSARSELFLSVMLDLIPFIGKILCEHHKDNLCSILETLSQIFQKRESTLVPTQKMLTAFNQNEKAPNWLQDKWNSLVKTLTPGGNGNWAQMEIEDWDIFDELVIRPKRGYFTEALSGSTTWNLEGITVPNHVMGHDYERKLSSVFRLFDSSKTEENLSTSGRIIVEQYIIDLFCALNCSHKVCMKNVLKLDFNTPIEYLVVEILFGQIFELPNPPYKQLYYEVLIVDGHKTSKSFSNALTEAIQIIFSRLNELDTECFDRFSSWFSFHLNSIDWKWDWDSWSDVIEYPETSHQKRFLCEVIEQCIRLSYHDKAVRTLPEKFHLLLPPRPTPTYAHANSEDASQILKKVEKRVGGDEIKELLDSLDISDDEKLEMFIQVILQRGHKSSTNVLRLFDRYLNLLQALITNTNQKIIVLNTIQSFWVNCQQNIIIIVDKLMTYCIVDNFSIIKWILSSKSGNQLKHGYLWIILRKTMEKTLARYDTIETRIQQVEKGEFSYVEDPRDPEEIKARKLADLQKRKDESSKELETLLLSAIEDFSVLLESPIVAQDSFVAYRIQGHLMELLRKHAIFVQKLMSNEETRGQILSSCTEETAQLLEATRCLI